ncbi:nucleotidyltransferase [Candidatus Bathyarchaeota archaeon]|nr:nucleotidyltransferase [Candidatus Bathyarchaeota archaeon]
MPTILRSLQRLLKLFEDSNVPYMIIGGYALPFYGRMRATVDIDLAVAIKSGEELNHFLNLLRSVDFEPTICSPKNPLIVILDQKEKIEIELWLRPDGIVFDEETLERRQKVKLDSNIWAWIVSAEDFIVNKLARPDRGVTDEQDVKSVLVRQENKLDNKYLQKRAREAGVLTILQTIQAS